MPTYYLYEEQAERLERMKAPASAVLGRAVERYRAGEFAHSVNFARKSKKRDFLPKRKVSVSSRFPGIDDERMREILGCHFAKRDVARQRTLDQMILEENLKIDKMMAHFTRHKYVIAK